MKQRRKYVGLVVMPVLMEPAGMLAASVTTHSQVKSAGQEVGVVYDMSATDGFDTNTGKTFSHEWEEGSGF